MAENFQAHTLIRKLLQGKHIHKIAGWSILVAFAFLPRIPLARSQDPSGPGITREAAENCARKVQRLQDNAARTEGPVKQEIRITQNELNSYFAYELSPKYHPSLRKISFEIEEGKLDCRAAVDFDRLEFSSAQFWAGLMGKLFSGVHTLSFRGGILSGAGRGQFQLEEARFDDTALPNGLVAEIITALCRRQSPPFDPMQPSEMPFAIKKVELHPGHIIVHQ